MAEYFTWTRLLQAGGLTLVVLIIASVVSFIVIIERALYFRAKESDPDDLTARVAAAIAANGASGVVSLFGSPTRPAEYVLHECALVADRLGPEHPLFEEAKSRAVAEKLPEMERYLMIEATLGTIAPFIGLLGTVVGIIRSFQSLGTGGQAGLAGLNAGIAEALIATAAGLFVAIPAVIAYNYFRRRVSMEILQVEILASRLKQMLQVRD